MFEYQATWLHTILVANGGPQLTPGTVLPEKPLFQLQRGFTYEVYTWSRGPSIPWTLIPLTLILLAAIVICICTIKARPNHIGLTDFDPLSPLDLMLVAAGGGLQLDLSEESWIRVL